MTDNTFQILLDLKKGQQLMLRKSDEGNLLGEIFPLQESWNDNGEIGHGTRKSSPITSRGWDFWTVFQWLYKTRPLYTHTANVCNGCQRNKRLSKTLNGRPFNSCWCNTRWEMDCLNAGTRPKWSTLPNIAIDVFEIFLFLSTTRRTERKERNQAKKKTY